jgi:hypothetical protein
MPIFNLDNQDERNEYAKSEVEKVKTKMKRAISIYLKDGFISVPVKDFSKENCIEAIAKGLKIDKENIEYLAGSMSGSIYGIKELYPNVSEHLDYSEDKKYIHNVTVKYGNIVE